jgi:hypothetical protein
MFARFKTYWQMLEALIIYASIQIHIAVTTEKERGPCSHYPPSCTGARSAFRARYRLSCIAATNAISEYAATALFGTTDSTGARITGRAGAAHHGNKQKKRARTLEISTSEARFMIIKN